MTKSSDSELVINIRNSNHEAFEQLFLRYHDELYKFLWRKTHSEELSKDFLQDTFKRLWINRTKLNPAKNIKAYLYKIAHNVVIEHVRKQQREKKYQAQSSLNQVDESIENESHIYFAINNLPKKFKEVFILNRFEGLKYSEIAQVYGISVKTVEYRMSKALKILQEELSDF